MSTVQVIILLVKCRFKDVNVLVSQSDISIVGDRTGRGTLSASCGMLIESYEWVICLKIWFFIPGHVIKEGAISLSNFHTALHGNFRPFYGGVHSDALLPSRRQG